MNVYPSGLHVLVVDCAETLDTIFHTLPRLLQRMLLVFLEIPSETGRHAVSDDPEFCASVGNEEGVVTDHHESSLEVLNGLNECIDTLHIQMVGS